MDSDPDSDGAKHAIGWESEEGFEQAASWEELYDERRYIKARCTYCCFAIQEEESVVVQAWYEGRMSAPFPWKAENEWFDRTLHIFFCVPPIDDQEREAPAWHESCFRFGKDKLGMRMGGRIHGMSRYQFQPPPEYDRRRFVRLQGEVGQCVRAKFPALPMDVCLVVAEYLVREYATWLVDSFWADEEMEEMDPFCEVDLQRDVWGRYVYFEETPYLAGLSNEPGPDYPTHILRAAPSNGTIVHTVADHQDIRFL
ncbi:hypothetical protein PG993_000181 [Apiospora rasikravindrae]|uniref:Uncharacterized protein n=1 Tax=Apiospora rasikravindrae TaxID=990691 RepID=A0ABR1U7V1_9PEZI